MKMLASRLKTPLSRLYAPTSVRRLSTVSTSPPIPVMYLDRGVIVINKPHGFICQYDMHVSHVAGRTLNIMRDIQALYKLPHLPYIVHRLDRPTTGVLLFATSSIHANKVGLQFRQRAVDKTYLAIVRGTADRFPQKTGVVEGIIYHLDTPGGSTTARPCAPELVRRKAETKSEWELLASSPVAPLSLVKVHPLTGFTHQIRVHMAEMLDVPILGDLKHLGTHSAELDTAITRVAHVPDDLLYLHAAELTFARYRPSGQRKKVALTVCAPLPDSFVRLCKDLQLPLPERYVNGGLYIDGKQI
ncbi:pseudouridine synthase [Daedalea quercina L-15889]|uniref:Pseudouridylate synthase RPUSD4, mitochondrial n=1 Tax=Daedalea quercina L-15889 TaxID=1314783 RepID=A0A165P7S0_9APHY|nr:pseudouridine synthase [Daedalea quercina L-15889]